MNAHKMSSATILEFAEPLLEELPGDYSTEMLDGAMTLVIAVWNSLVMDEWNGDNKLESELISRLEFAPQGMNSFAQLLIARKKLHFAADKWAVGRHWIKEKNGGPVFGCEMHEEPPVEPNSIH